MGGVLETPTFSSAGTAAEYGKIGIGKFGTGSSSKKTGEKIQQRTVVIL